MAILFTPCRCTHPPLPVPSALSAHAEPIFRDIAKKLQHKLKVSWRVYLSLVVKGLIVDFTLRLSVWVHWKYGEQKFLLRMFVATTVPCDLLAKYSRVKKSQEMLPILLVQNQLCYQEWHHEAECHMARLGPWVLETICPVHTGGSSTSVPQYNSIS